MSLYRFVSLRDVFRNLDLHLLSVFVSINDKYILKVEYINIVSRPLFSSGASLFCLTFDIISPRGTETLVGSGAIYDRSRGGRFLKFLKVFGT